MANSKTGVKNVYLRSDRGTYQVQLKLNGKIKRFGAYKTLEEATIAAVAARTKYHGEFANHEQAAVA